MVSSLNDLQSSLANAAVTDSISVYGTLVAPGAATQIASTAAFTAANAGVYQITVIVGYGSTADVADNMSLRVNGSPILTLPVIAAANGVRIPITVTRRVNAASVISVNSIAAGGVGSVYVAHIIAQKVAD